MATYSDYQNILAQAIGTENYYRHGVVKNLVYTDGVKAVASKLECYWLIDVVASWIAYVEQIYSSRGSYSVLNKVSLTTNSKRKGADFKITTYDYATERDVKVVSQRIGRTDIPRDTENKTTEYEFFLRRKYDGGYVLFLTSEY